jgi:hypothetical protein
MQHSETQNSKRFKNSEEKKIRVTRYSGVSVSVFGPLHCYSLQLLKRYVFHENGQLFMFLIGTHVLLTIK